jgi:hypothetical protein
VGEAIIAVRELDRLRRGYGAVQQVNVILSQCKPRWEGLDSCGTNTEYWRI